MPLRCYKLYQALYPEIKFLHFSCCLKASQDVDRPVAADTDFVIKVVSTFVVHKDSLQTLRTRVMLVEKSITVYCKMPSVLEPDSSGHYAYG